MSRPWEEFQKQAEVKPWEEFAATPAAPEPEAPGFIDSMKTMITNDPMVNTVVGAAKDLGSTAYELFKRTQHQNPLTPALIKMPDQKPEWLQPSNTAQKVGGALSTALQFAAPSNAMSGIPAVEKSGVAARALTEALISGGVSTARGDSPSDAGRNALMSGGITGALGAAGKLAGPLGERIEVSLLKPLKADLQDVKGPPELAPQTMIKNVFKYDLGGTLPESLAKANVKTKELGQQLRQALGSNPLADVDMTNVLKQAATELNAASAGNFGTNQNISKALEKMADEIKAVSPNGMVNLADAQEMKQALGYMGSWQNGLRDADSTALETVANTMYSKLKTAIEQNSGQSQVVKDINNQFSEIIPIKNALIRRIPVAARREPVSLKEFIALSTGNIKGIGLGIMDRALRSGNVANALVQSGKAPVQNAARVAPGLTGSMDALIKGLQERKQ